MTRFILGNIVLVLQIKLKNKKIKIALSNSINKLFKNSIQCLHHLFQFYNNQIIQIIDLDYYQNQ